MGRASRLVLEDGLLAVHYGDARLPGGMRIAVAAAACTRDKGRLWDSAVTPGTRHGCRSLLWTGGRLVASADGASAATVERLDPAAATATGLVVLHSHALPLEGQGRDPLDCATSAAFALGPGASAVGVVAGERLWTSDARCPRPDRGTRALRYPDHCLRWTESAALADADGRALATLCWHARRAPTGRLAYAAVMRDLRAPVEPCAVLDIGGAMGVPLLRHGLDGPRALVDDGVMRWDATGAPRRVVPCADSCACCADETRAVFSSLCWPPTQPCPVSVVSVCDFA